MITKILEMVWKFLQEIQKLKLFVIPTNEELMIAKETLELVKIVKLTK